MLKSLKSLALTLQKDFSTENDTLYYSSGNTSNAFYKLWTIKESYIKQSGEGLRTPLNSFEININKDTITVSENNTKKNCHITHFEFKNHSFAICSMEEPPLEIEFNYL